MRERTAGPYERNIDCHRRDALVLATEPKRLVSGPEWRAERGIFRVHSEQSLQRVLQWGNRGRGIERIGVKREEVDDLLVGSRARRHKDGRLGNFSNSL